MISITTYKSLRFFDLCYKGNIFVIVISFSFVTILPEENKPFCLEVLRV